ncbi:MAG: hypothetical protein ACOCYR_04965 [Erythrobacter sp.]|uniref:hypothetical protein n=1 Tax=Erythrobacter sp. HL-111 TaxID=1798193 RepID=UPI0006DB4C7D|nr:hypothetical protein [Erythrobacter sp. HL-111]KPP91238.1 MAG: Phage late control gene D protein (GPD) [Erythrobacteraceae bacterium HL-111]SDT07162.1 hypothetical protein SAMN04515621_2845 [Erythrobacter sp. HL-111]
MTDSDSQPRSDRPARGHPRDYDTPETPEGTPPVIRPDREEERIEQAQGTDREAREKLEKRQRRRADREGAGEQELDSMRPETLFPPD